MERIFTVEFLPYGDKVKTISNERVMDAARVLGFDLESECGGKGTCGKCMVRLVRSYYRTHRQ